ASATLASVETSALNGTITTTGGNVTLNSDSDGTGGGAIIVNGGASITTNGGDIRLAGGVGAAGSAVGTATDIVGIRINNATLDAGAGDITLIGTGFAGTTGNHGIQVMGGAGLLTTTGTITLDGTGGAGTGTNKVGVLITDAGTTITTQDGALDISGVGGTGLGTHHGIAVVNGAVVQSTGTGSITLNGT